ncbi:MAG TPA: glycine cleavage system aminomethyltransferase GcvT, partial [Nitrospiraceae bacterium]|nr:glycine cleavage system aminomethyltransferase GcvT [Nitrospiraceae bacterium]
MKRTPLFDGHTASNAKLVDFSGWEMPIQYSGVVDEYQTVRTRAGLFDVSHMGRIAVAGDGALPFLQRLTTNNVAKLRAFESQYSMVCNQRGGIKDDIFVYRVKPQEFLLCVNASNREKIVAWLHEQGSGPSGVEIRDRSAELAQLALQGPASRSILETLGVPGLAALKPRQCLEVKLLGVQALVTRTGYTGELGYELYVPANGALLIWNDLLTNGKAAGIKPVGLGARDLLRLEMAYLLYGNDISEDTTPLEAGMEWVVDFQKGEFIGRDALQQQKDGGVARRLTAFELLEKAVPRQGYKILPNSRSDGKQIGEV